MATYLKIDGDRIEMIAADFAGTEKQIDAACRRAVSKLARHLRTVTLRGVSDLTGIKQSVLRKRLFYFFWRWTANRASLVRPVCRPSARNEPEADEDRS